MSYYDLLTFFCANVIIIIDYYAWKCQFMRKGTYFFVIVAILFVVTICSEPAMASSIEATSESIQSSQSSNYSVKNLIDIIKGSLSIGSFIMSILLPSLAVIIFRKEFPKKYVPILSLVFFIVVAGYRVLLKICGQAEIVGTVYLTILFIVVSLYGIKMYYKYSTENNDECTSNDSNPQKKARNYIKTKINKCHPAIESIQLYSYREVKTDHSTEYIIEYIDGAKKPHIEINALLGINLSLDNDTFEEAQGIITFYNNYLNAASAQQLDTSRIVLEEAIAKGTSRIKGILSQIEHTEDVTGADCSLARVLMVYCSILASLNKETTFVGFGDNALGLAKDIEQTLFTAKRTGVLGAILLQYYPYGFYYNRNSDKSGRTYCAFACKSKEQEYLVLIAFRMKNGSILPDIGVSRSLMKIRETLLKRLEAFPQGGDEG